jgi:hypothetical protein
VARPPATAGSNSTADRLTTLEEEVARLRQEFAAFRKQFE